MITASDKTVGRLSLYRRILGELQTKGATSLYSHELAAKAGVTAAQVRRDLMAVGYSGTPTKGYSVPDLAASIAAFLDAPGGQGVALVGIGNLGRAILAYFVGRRPNLSIVAAFDNDAGKIERLIHSCPCYGMQDLPRIISEKDIRVGIIAVPAAHAQAAADALTSAGVKGLLNFAPVSLRVPPDVYVEHNDITSSLEKVSYFARRLNG